MRCGRVLRQGMITLAAGDTAEDRTISHASVIPQVRRWMPGSVTRLGRRPIPISLSITGSLIDGFFKLANTRCKKFLYL